MSRHRLLLTLLLSLIFSSGNAQQGLLQFTGIQVKQTVFLTFTLEAGITCSGLVIERSQDTVGFTELISIPGICGSASSQETYYFTDSLPFANRVNHYRLNLGNLGYSKPIAVSFFLYNEEGGSVTPNPIVTSGWLYFSNPKLENHSLLIYTMQGQLVKKQAVSGSQVLLDRNSFSGGMYHYQLIREKDQEVTVNGRIVFQ